jgi:signal transduction histidine kinase/ligand-binding sensor domain-containing protein
MKKAATLLLFLSVMSGALQSQVRENVYFHHLTQQNGLLKDYNWYIYPDSKGLVWISSSNGLARFDGIQVKYFLPNDQNPNALKGINVIGDFIESKSSDIWFAADNYLCQYVRNQDKFLHYQVTDSSGVPASGYYRLLTQDIHGDIWILIDDETIGSPVYKFHTDPVSGSGQFQWVCNLGVSANRCYPIKNKGEITGFFAFGWGEKMSYLKMLLPRTADTKTFQFTIPGSTETGAVLDVLDLNNGLFYVVSDPGLFLINSENPVPELLLKEKGITSIAQAPNGNLFLGTDLGEILEVTTGLNYTIKERFLSQKQATSNSLFITHLHIDANATLWLSYYYNGIAWVNLNKTKYDVVQHNLDSKKQPSSIRSVISDENGQVWGLSHRTLIQFDASGNAISRYSAHHDTFPFQKMLFIAPQTIGLLNHDEIVAFDLKSKRFNQVARRKDNEPGYLDFCSIGPQSILVGMFEGAKIFENKGKKGYEKRNLNIVSDSGAYTDLFCDQQGRLYIYQDLNELIIFEYKSGVLKKIGQPILFKAEITSWAEDNTFVWAATNLGLLQIHKQTNQNRFFTMNDGLPGLNISNLVLDKQQGLWMNINGKLVYYKNGKASTFSKADGASETIATDGSSALDANGALWVPAVDGLIVSRENATKPYSGKAGLYIDAIQINEKIDTTLRCALTGASQPDDIRKIVLPYEKSNLKINFLSMEYGDPENNFLEYQIIGADTSWIRTPNPGYARFLGVREGTYQLRIRAFNADGIPGSDIRTITVVIKPPFERSPLLYLLVVLGAISIVILIFQYLRMQERRMQAMRQQIADDLHDELGSVLTGILMFSDALRMKASIQQDQDAVYKLGRIGQNAQKTLNSFRDIVWSINPKYDRMEQLVFRMRAMISEASDASMINFVFAPQLQGYEQIKLNPQLRHNLFLVFSEAFNNALKYSKADKIEIIFKVIDQKITLEVHDDGVGFDMEAPASGNGLSNLHKRARTLKGVFKMESKTGFGTHLFLQVSLREHDNRINMLWKGQNSTMKS